MPESFEPDIKRTLPCHLPTTKSCVSHTWHDPCVNAAGHFPENSRKNSESMSARFNITLKTGILCTAKKDSSLSLEMCCPSFRFCFILVHLDWLRLLTRNSILQIIPNKLTLALSCYKLYNDTSWPQAQSRTDNYLPTSMVQAQVSAEWLYMMTHSQALNTIIIHSK